MLAFIQFTFFQSRSPAKADSRNSLQLTHTPTPSAENKAKLASLGLSDGVVPGSAAAAAAAAAAATASTGLKRKRRVSQLERGVFFHLRLSQLACNVSYLPPSLPPDPFDGPTSRSSARNAPSRAQRARASASPRGFAA